MLNLKSSLTRVILSEMFLHQDRPYYAEEWVRGFNLDRGNLSRKLRQLESEGILTGDVKGKEKYYRLNRDYPFLEEYRQIILKSFGVEAEIRKAVRSVAGVQKAFLFGSYAEDKMDGASDIDLAVVGDHDTIELQKKITQIQKNISREINVISMASSEYEKKRKSNNFFKRMDRLKRIDLL